MMWRIKEWLLMWLEPYREERASYLLQWRIFAQKHNAAGYRPKCMYEGMEKDLDLTEKVKLMDFREVDHNYLRDMMRIKGHGQ